MNKNIAIGVGVASLLMLLLISVGGYFGYTKLFAPTRAYASANEAMSEFTSAEYTFVQTTTMEFSANGIDDISMKSKVIGNGKIDVEAEKLYMLMDVSIDSQKVPTFEYYLIEDQIYIVSGDEVVQMSMQEAIAQLGSDIETIDSFQTNQLWTSTADSSIEYEYIGETEIDGIEVYEYKVMISEDDIESFTGALGAGLQSALGDNFSTDSLSINNMIYKVYVSKEDSSPVKEVIAMDSITFEFEGIKAAMNDYIMSLTYSNVNGDIVIEAPDVE
jgi:hypothetical protein